MNNKLPDSFPSLFPYASSSPDSDFEFVSNNVDIEVIRLHDALKAGDQESIHSLSHELERLNDDDLIRVLFAKDKDEVHGLAYALGGGHTLAIEAYGNLLKKFDNRLKGYDKPRFSLLKIDGIYWALRNGHGGAINAFCNLLKDQSAVFNSQIWHESGAELSLGLKAAIENRHFHILEPVYTLLDSVIHRIHQDEISDVLGVLRSEVLDHEEIASFFCTIVKLVKKELGADTALKIIGRIHIHHCMYGAPPKGLVSALQEGDKRVRRYFDQLKSNLDQKDIDAILSRESRYINFSFYDGMAFGEHNKIEEITTSFIELKHILSVEEMSKLILARDWKNKVCGLISALEKGYTESICAYGKLLLALPHEGNGTAVFKEIFCSKDKKGASHLILALSKGHAEATKAFDSLLIEFKEALDPETIENVFYDGEHSVRDSAYVMAAAHLRSVLKEAGILPESLEKHLAEQTGK